MRKFGVAPEGVAARMVMDGVDEALVRRFKISQKIDDDEPVSPRKPKRRATIGLHWETMDHSENSVWAESGERLDDEDVATLNDIFAPSKGAVVTTTATGRRSTKSPLDAKKAQNTTIALAATARRFRGDFDRVWRAVAECSSSIPADALERLEEALPSRAERDAVVAWAANGSPPRKPGPAELFVLATARCGRHAEFLECAKFRAALAPRARAVDAGAAVATDAAEALVASRGLTLVLRRILAVGNAMNASARARVHAFEVLS